MSGIQRVYVKNGLLAPLEDEYLDTTEWGLVTYKDHVAALAAQATAHEAAPAEAGYRQLVERNTAVAEARADMDHVSYVLGQRAERARIRAAVEALDGDYSCDVGSHLDVGAVLAVIDALKGES